MGMMKETSELIEELIAIYESNVIFHKDLEKLLPKDNYGRLMAGSIAYTLTGIINNLKGILEEENKNGY